MEMNVKYQIFISSTFKDLLAERDEVIKGILSYYHIPIGMEMFTADNDEQWETIRETIESSDYYVLIIGHRYGSVTKEGISFTEKEFQFAKKSGIPILAFIRDRDIPTSPNQREEQATQIQKLNQFIRAVMDGRLVSYWANKEDLAAKVMAAISKTISRNPRTGWIRANSIPNSDIVLKQISDLTQENTELKKSLQVARASRRPNFSISINGKNSLEMDLDLTDYHSRFMNIKAVAATVNPDKLNIVGSLLDENDLKNVIEEYNAEVLDYLREHHFSQLEIALTNIGTGPANEIFIDLTFPWGMNVINPREFRLLPFEPRSGAKLNEFGIEVPDFNSEYKRLNSVLGHPMFENLNGEITLESEINRITLRVRRLMHTRKILLPKLLFSSFRKVTDQNIEISVICNELSESVRSIVPVSITF